MLCGIAMTDVPFLVFSMDIKPEVQVGSFI
jgi:hypothetical protein